MINNTDMTNQIQNLTDLTEMEQITIKGIALNEYQPNGKQPKLLKDGSVDHTPVYTDDLNEIINSFENRKSLSGCVSSLVKKGLVWADGDCIGFTENGEKLILDLCYSN
jgi:hypothetical protein